MTPISYRDGNNKKSHFLIQNLDKGPPPSERAKHKLTDLHIRNNIKNDDNANDNIEN